MIVGILVNSDKDPVFEAEERKELIDLSIAKGVSNVETEVFSGLLVDYAHRRDAHVIIRGIRAVSDYEYELQMALMNRRLQPDIETLFMLPSENYSYLSSRLIKEIAELGGSVKGLVPDLVERRLLEKFS